MRRYVGYAMASMRTRPPLRTWMLRSCMSKNSIPTSGVVSAASASTYLGWPSHSTENPVGIEGHLAAVGQGSVGP